MKTPNEGSARSAVGGHIAPPKVQELWIRQLQCFFHLYNEQYLRGQLRLPIFRIGTSTCKLGEWDPVRRSLTISEDHILMSPWEAVLDTLRHEMAHQYVHEVLMICDARPHGKAFEEACRLLRCDPATRVSGESLGSTEESRNERDKMIRRVKELLALAGSPNEHEAANAMRMANKYLLKYNLSLTDAEGSRQYAVRHLGKCSGRVQEYEYTLSSILQNHFFVMVIWTFSYNPRTNKRGRILQISGTPENLEIAEYVYRYVMGLTDRLWQAHRSSNPSATGTKLQYLAGLLRGLGQKLEEQKRALKEEKGLVWLGDSKLKEFFRHMHPYIRSISGSGVSRGERYHAGVKDGREITIRRGVSGQTTNRGRLLE